METLGLLSSDTSVAQKAVPRLKLLMELEPAREVFFGNLADAFSLRQPPPIALTSPPGEFWHDVFVPTEMPWRSFQESIMWHMVVVLAGWALTHTLASRPQPRVNQSSYRTASSVYYSPSKILPNTRSSPPKASARNKGRSASASPAPKPMPVAAERSGKPGLVVPPDLKMAMGNQAPNLSAAAAMPAVPLSATARTAAPMGGLNSVVAPPPDIGGRGNRLSSLPQSAVVAPPADVAGMGDRRSLRGPGASVIEPPPAVRGAARGLGGLNGGSGQVVAPPPQVPSQGLGSGAGSRALGGMGAVVPPPPSLGHSGRAGTLSGPGTAVVPPPPSVQGGSSGGILASLSSLFSGGASKVVPPPPGVPGEGSGSGSGSRVGSLAGAGSQVVPPPPAMQGGGTGRGRITSLPSGGSEIVPPPPSVQGAGGTSARGGGLGNSMSSGGSGIVPPPPVVSGAGSGRGMGSGNRSGGSLSGGAADVVPPPPSVAAGNGGGSGTGSRLGSLSGGGSAVVPPPPALQGSGAGNGSGEGNGNGNGNGRLTSHIAGGGNVIAPPPSLAGEGGSGGNARAGGLAGGGLGASPPPAHAGGGSGSTGVPLPPMDPLPDVPAPTQAAPVNPTASGEDVPLRLIGVPVASSKTSFFSNFEVFLAERKIGQGRTELIKLVYIFLPYQKRLSEYDWSTTKIYKLRAVRDQSCDETLMQMTWPEGEDQPDPAALAAADSIAPNGSNKNTNVPCFRTTADDFQRAISHR